VHNGAERNQGVGENPSRSLELDIFQLSDWIHEIYESAVEPSNLAKTLHSVGLALGAARSSLCWINTHNYSISSHIGDGFLDSDIDRFNRAFFSSLPRIDQLKFRRLHKGYLDSDLVSQAVLNSHPFYQIYQKSMKNRFSVFSAVDRREKEILVLNYDFQAPPNLSVDLLRLLLGILSPHIKRALTQWQRQTDDIIARKIHNTPELSSTSARFVLDSNFEVKSQNKNAERLINRNDGLFLLRSKLCAYDKSSSAHLNKALRNALAKKPGGEQKPLQFAVNRSNHVTPYFLTIESLFDPDCAPSQSASTLLVSCVDLAAEIELSSSFLKQAYAFTDKEIHVANDLVNGLSISDIAEKQNLAVETIRWRLKTIQSKTHTRRQAELVRLLYPTSSVKNDAL